jgi:hypothetical protein
MNQEEWRSAWAHISRIGISSKAACSVAFLEIEPDASINRPVILMPNFPERSKGTSGMAACNVCCLLKERVMKIGQRTVAKRWS